MKLELPVEVYDQITALSASGPAQAIVHRYANFC